MNKESFKKSIDIKVEKLSKNIDLFDIKDIDILKIDTEGYELKVLKGVNPDQFNLIRYIYFEHHYDQMIKKNYKYSDIKIFLNKNNFYLSFKVKMRFRKTFEYIYENRNK